MQAFLADDPDRMVALVTEHAWFRMPPANLEYQGKRRIQAMLSALANHRAGQPTRIVATRANGQPAYGTYRIDPASGLAHPTGLLVLSLTGWQIAALTWFVGPAPLAAFGLPSAPQHPSWCQNGSNSKPPVWPATARRTECPATCSASAPPPTTDPPPTPGPRVERVLPGDQHPSGGHRQPDLQPPDNR